LITGYRVHGHWRCYGDVDDIGNGVLSDAKTPELVVNAPRYGSPQGPEAKTVP
jgi:hypothetical protein